MKLEDVQKTVEPREIVISIRINKEQSKWMKDNNVSPTLLFNKALEELQTNIGKEGFKELARWKGK